jgi:uncharacterized protein
MPSLQFSLSVGELRRQSGRILQYDISIFEPKDKGLTMIGFRGALFMFAAFGMPCPVAAQADFAGFTTQVEPARSYAAWQRSAWYITARDGVRLAITVYLPRGHQPEGFPVLLWYHPGHRESIDPRTGALHPVMPEADIAFWTGHGYAVAVAEMRGSGASFGSRELDRGPQIGRDGKDIVDWIARQSWSNGAVGMIGASYQGFAQYATAAERPRNLWAIFPEIAGFDDYTSMFFPGGIPVPALTGSAVASIRLDDLNHFDLSDARRPRYPSAPVIDEDGDGELADEIPLDANGNGTFLDDGEPRYADGQPRSHVYWQATLAHRANRNLTLDRLLAAPHRDSRIDGLPYRWRDLDPGSKPQGIARSGIAVYHRGGWFDYHARDTAMWQATLAGRTPSFMMMAPVGHGGLPVASGGEAIYRAGPYLAHFGDATSTNTAMNLEKLAFFDRYVKGVANGFEQRPPVLIYIMGKGWRREAEWPLSRARNLTLMPDAGGRLSEGTVPTGQDHHAVDLAASSLSNGANRWNFGISSARKPMTLDGQVAQRLSYTGAPLAQDTEVTGHPLLELVLSSSEAEGDVFAYLEDVAPDGSSLLVTEGQLRANYHRLVPGGPARGARPELPWQGFAANDYRPRPFAKGKQVRLRMDMMPTAWLFAKGQRLRLTLAGADWPSFALHPGLSPANNPAAPDTRRPVWTLWRGAGLSSLTLPVVPDSK